MILDFERKEEEGDQKAQEKFFHDWLKKIQDSRFVFLALLAAYEQTALS